MLKLAVLSDFHLGFGQGTDVYDDSFGNASLALELAAKSEPSLILLVGDIFHEKVPKPEVLAQAIEMFSKTNRMVKSSPLLVKKVKNNKTEEVKKAISSVICVWGTHERRSTQSINPVQLLEKAGLVYCLHNESIQLSIGYDKVGLHGLSGEPEQYAKGALKEWNPKPLPDSFNIMLLHQNFKELLPVQEDEWLSFSDLPEGFDLFLLGHFHANYEGKHPDFNTPILIPGSTITTQITKVESEKKKGFYILEIGRQKVDVKFISIPTRQIFYEKLNVSGKRPVEISMEISAQIKKCLDTKPKQKPLIKIKLSGVLAEGFSPADLNFGSMMDEYGPNAIVSLDKSDLKSASLEKQSELLQRLKEEGTTLDQVGLNLLKEAIKENISLQKLEDIFNYLVNNAFEQAEAEILAEDAHLKEEETLKMREVERLKLTAIPEPDVTPGLEAPRFIESPKPTEVQEEVRRPEPIAEAPKSPSKQPTLVSTAKVARKRELSPKEVELAESGVARLAVASGSLQKTVIPKSQVSTAKVTNRPHRAEASAQQTQLASSGLTKLAVGAKSTVTNMPTKLTVGNKSTEKQEKKSKFNIDEWLHR